MKKTLKFMLCGATVMLFAACGGASSDGEKLAQLEYDAAQAAQKDPNSEEAKKALEEATNFAKEVQEKYKDDTAAQKEFTEAYTKKLEELSKQK